MKLFIFKTRYVLLGSVVVPFSAILTGELVGAIFGYIGVLCAIKAYDALMK